VSGHEVLGYLANSKEYETTEADFVIPFSTPPCDLRVTGENDPHWNSEFTLDESIQHILDPNVVILFEILDFNFKLVR
jgi:hypothetical protein